MMNYLLKIKNQNKKKKIQNMKKKNYKLKLIIKKKIYKIIKVWLKQIKK